MESEAPTIAATPLAAIPTEAPATVPVAPVAATPPPMEPPMPPTTASHMGWLALSIVLFIIGLLAGSGGGYYLGLQQSESMIEQPPVYDQTAPTDTGVQTQTDTTSTNPLNDVKLNPFE